jgi:myosin-1
MPLKKLDSKKRPETAGSQFRNAMNALISTLLSCSPHYVRCIKPNDMKRPGDLEETRVRHQIRYLGLVENVRVRRAGFANRQEFNRFYQRYKMLSSSTWPHHELSKNAKTITQEPVIAILTDTVHNISNDEYRVGKTKIFIRNPKVLFYFEEMRAQHLPKVATIIQKVWKGYKARVFFEKLKAAITLQSHIRLHMTLLWYKRTKAAIMVQKTFRGYKDHSVWLRKKAVLKIQLWYRGVKAMKWIRAVQESFKNAAIDPHFGGNTIWPTHFSVMNRGADLVKQIHQSWRVYKLLGTLDAPQKDAMRMKILAYDLFHSKKPYR